MSQADIAIANKLFAAGIRLEGRDDTRALQRAPEELKPQLLAIWLEECGHDVDIVINATELLGLVERTHQQLIESTLYEQFERAAWDDVDTELWIIQCERTRDQRNDERSALLKEQAA